MYNLYQYFIKVPTPSLTTFEAFTGLKKQLSFFHINFFNNLLTQMPQMLIICKYVFIVVIFDIFNDNVQVVFNFIKFWLRINNIVCFILVGHIQNQNHSKLINLTHQEMILMMWPVGEFLLLPLQLIIKQVKT